MSTICVAINIHSPKSSKKGDVGVGWLEHTHSSVCIKSMRKKMATSADLMKFCVVNPVECKKNKAKKKVEWQWEARKQWQKEEEGK